MSLNQNLSKRIERVIGEDVDGLLEELRVVGEERARYRAMFYSSFSGTSINDEMRKVAKAAAVRRSLGINGKMAANLVEALAYEDVEYRSFVDKQYQERLAFEALDARYEYLKYRLEVVKQKLYFNKAEAALA